MHHSVSVAVLESGAMVKEVISVNYVHLAIVLNSL